ncbi:MAG: helix-turn-helix domain-containing protein [Gemmatimonadetes bacterium]|nr:helix-turn-helix domain-containing protein [Gemmatimonadota bacterium]
MPPLIREGLAAGLSLRDIGRMLGVSYETVRRLRSRPGL